MNQWSQPFLDSLTIQHSNFTIVWKSKCLDLSFLQKLHSMKPEWSTYLFFCLIFHSPTRFQCTVLGLRQLYQTYNWFVLACPKVWHYLVEFFWPHLQTCLSKGNQLIQCSSQVWGRLRHVLWINQICFSNHRSIKKLW